MPGLIKPFFASTVVNLLIRVVLRIDPNTSFGTPKWHVDHCTLRCRERSQSFYFIPTHISAIRDTTLAGFAVLTVLGWYPWVPLPGALVSTDGEGQAQHMAAGLDDLQEAPYLVPLLLRLPLAGPEVLQQLVLHDADTVVKETLHHLKDIRVPLL